MKDAISLLKKDHATVKKLFRRYEKSGPGDIETRAVLFRQIYDELTLHTEIEEELLYPLLEAMDTDQSDEVRDEAREEHAEVKALLDELNYLETDSSRFTLDVGKVIQGVEHHIKEEEEKIFPLLKRRFSKTRLEAIGHDIEQRKSALA
jgi:hemerythrin superfamily protein